MPFDSKNFEIEDALATSQDIYEVQFPEWGVRTVPASFTAVNPNFQFPPPGSVCVPSTLAAMAIGGRSTIDRCWVSWDRQKIGPAFTDVEAFGIESLVRPLSIDRPLSFSQTTKRGILPSTVPAVPLTVTNNDPRQAMHDGFLYVFPKQPDVTGIVGADAANPQIIAANTTILPEKYADEVGVVRDLTGAGFSLFQPPYLELNLYLQPPVMALPTKRFPQVNAGSYTPLAVVGFQPMQHIPIFGRKHVSITLRSRGVVIKFRIGLLRCVCENDAGFTTDKTPFDAPGGVTTPAFLPAFQSVNFQLDNVGADYLNLYVDSGGAADLVEWEMYATD